MAKFMAAFAATGLAIAWFLPAIAQFPDYNRAKLVASLIYDGVWYQMDNYAIRDSDGKAIVLKGHAYFDGNFECYGASDIECKQIKEILDDGRTCGSPTDKSPSVCDLPN